MKYKEQTIQTKNLCFGKINTNTKYCNSLEKEQTCLLKILQLQTNVFKNYFTPIIPNSYLLA